MKKVLTLVVCLLMVAVMMAGCGKPADPAPAPSDTASAPVDESVAPSEAVDEPAPVDDAGAESAPVAGKKFKVGFAIKNLDDQFMKKENELILEYADAVKDQMELEVLDSASDVNKQIENVESFVTRGFDVIVTHPVDVDGSSKCVELANEAGIPIVHISSKTTNTNWDAYVGVNDVEAGQMQAKWINENFPEAARVCYILGPIGESAQILREEGTQKDLFDARKDIELLQKQTADWDRNKAMALVEDWMTQYKNDIDAILCQNDDMAMGAVIALENLGMKDKVKVIGCDAIKEAVQAVKDGRLDATLLFNQPKMCESTINAALALAKGEEFPKETNEPFKLVVTDTISEFEWILAD